MNHLIENPTKTNPKISYIPCMINFNTVETANIDRVFGIHLPDSLRHIEGFYIQNVL